jgi:hypothetical protein
MVLGSEAGPKRRKGGRTGEKRLSINGKKASRTSLRNSVRGSGRRTSGKSSSKDNQRKKNENNGKKKESPKKTSLKYLRRQLNSIQKYYASTSNINCGANTVLMAAAPTPHYILMACRPPTVCEKQQTCTSVTCGGELSFLAKFQQFRIDGQVIPQCCAAPKPQDHEATICANVIVSDTRVKQYPANTLKSAYKQYEAEFSNLPSVKSIPNGMLKKYVKNWKKAVKVLRTGRFKRAAAGEVLEEGELLMIGSEVHLRRDKRRAHSILNKRIRVGPFKFNDKKGGEYFLMVKDIINTNSGYAVQLCGTKCRRRRKSKNHEEGGLYGLAGLAALAALGKGEVKVDKMVNVETDNEVTLTEKNGKVSITETPEDGNPIAEDEGEIAETESDGKGRGSEKSEKMNKSESKSSGSDKSEKSEGSESKERSSDKSGGSEGNSGETDHVETTHVDLDPVEPPPENAKMESLKMFQF